MAKVSNVLLAKVILNNVSDTRVIKQFLNDNGIKEVTVRYSGKDVLSIDVTNSREKVADTYNRLKALVGKEPEGYVIVMRPEVTYEYTLGLDTTSTSEYGNVITNALRIIEDPFLVYRRQVSDGSSYSVITTSELPESVIKDTLLILGTFHTYMPPVRPIGGYQKKVVLPESTEG